jgi:hypothetical protein
MTLPPRASPEKSKILCPLYTWNDEGDKKFDYDLFCKNVIFAYFVPECKLKDSNIKIICCLVIEIFISDSNCSVRFHGFAANGFQGKTDKSLKFRIIFNIQMIPAAVPLGEQLGGLHEHAMVAGFAAEGGTQLDFKRD